MRRILVANRGEIACRIMRTCRRLGIRSIAVYSDVDRDAPHVHAADDAVRIGPAPAADSYLSIPALIAAARATSADAVHPGYGFLSEHADFAEACVAAGLTWIGPPAEAIRRMGSKTAARDLAAAAGVPIVPGLRPVAQTDAAIADALAAIGLPALIKASAGGGGRGMRIVRTGGEALDAIRAARRESERAFGAGDLYVERLVERARHVEVQIFGDDQGSIVHLFERDCSLQRRHQKVVEEAPAWHLSPAVRERVTRAAVDVARAAGYRNAGTVEFLVEGDGDEARCHFLEMNTRLQVEHPVTESITGIDMVEAQIVVAFGAPLPFGQDAIARDGHAVECRVLAEGGPRLLPQSGRLLRYREPSGPGIRVDAGVIEGQTITVHYDPLLAKLIAHAPTREQAMAAAHSALGAFEILGLRHNVGFLRRLLSLPDVASGRTHTRLIEEQIEALVPAPEAVALHAAAALAARLGGTEPGPEPLDRRSPAVADPWDRLGRLAW
jgi:acetyl-CoA/propionyl-CoA carboxylase biotin carboxyl carrier protein